ncbi:MAG: peptide chain release factor N(5)-glutamine methyltransferase [Eubacteriaceae bacterium]|nr:peptide chain release factor N(5)-glutamine methyltransferase [Eubacteriaceae bacterium]
MDVKSLLDLGRKALLQAKIEYPGLEAEILLSHVLNCDRIIFYAHPEKIVDKIQEATYLRAVERRCQHEPIAYILGQKEFMGMNFIVNSSVLIPRPDTESMVEYLIERLQSDYPKGAKVFDLCTGSGAIGISIKKYYSQGMIALGDISKDALSVANANGNRLVKGDLTLYQGDLFGALPKDERFNVIVSNPPYIKREEMKALATDILNYEPHLALDGGASGLDFYECIVTKAKDYLLPAGILALEIGDDQEDSVFELLVNNGYVAVKKHYDLSGHVRCLVGELTEKL